MWSHNIKRAIFYLKTGCFCNVAKGPSESEKPLGCALRLACCAARSFKSCACPTVARHEDVEQCWKSWTDGAEKMLKRLWHISGWQHGGLLRHDVRAVQNLQGAREHAENRRYCEETAVTVREPSAPRLAACFQRWKKGRKGNRDC